MIIRLLTSEQGYRPLPLPIELTRLRGLVGVGGFIPATTLGQNYPPGQLTLTLGSHGFFGYGPCNLTPSSNGAYQSQYGTNRADRIPSTPAKDAVWWSTYQVQDLPDSNNLDFEDIKSQLQNRHSNFKNPIIQNIIANVTIDSIYPTWTTPSLPTWSTNNIALVGDAAHALQTSSGQGASQALEDAQVIAMLLAHHLRHSTLDMQENISLALKQYVEIRKPRIERIAEHARKMGDMKRKKGKVEEWVTYFFIWAMGLLPRSWNSYDLFLSKELPGEKVRQFIDAEEKREVRR